MDINIDVPTESSIQDSYQIESGSITKRFNKLCLQSIFKIICMYRVFRDERKIFRGCDSINFVME